MSHLSADRSLFYVKPIFMHCNQFDQALLARLCLNTVKFTEVLFCSVDRFHFNAVVSAQDLNQTYFPGQTPSCAEFFIWVGALCFFNAPDTLCTANDSVDSYA